jgi:phytoene dehydrogenase-like protein
MANAQPVSKRVVVIGAGHNGLIAACYLAKAGFAPLVLERRGIAGGTAVTEEIHPGFRCPAVFHSIGPLLPQIMTDLDLARQGLEVVSPAIRILALQPSGPPIRIYDDPIRTSAELASVSARDAKMYPEFHASFAKIGQAMAPLLPLTPPDVDDLNTGDYLNLAKLGLKFRGLDKKNAYRLLRWGPMAVADLAAEWFESELLRSVVEARGIFGVSAGPWSAGTSLGLLLQAAVDRSAIAPASFFKGGIGSLTQALAKAASAAGAQIRTGAEVAQVRVEGGAVSGVVLASGEEIPAKAVVSNADPRRTFLKLIDATNLDPSFLTRIQNYRSNGCVAKVNLALSGLPRFAGVKGEGGELGGRIHIGPDTDYIERAFDASKYGDFSSEPYMDITIPTVQDPSLAPAGGHVMSIHVQYAPYRLKNGDWRSRREELGDAVVKTLSTYAPNVRELILARKIITPLDLEETYGLTGGHIFHGEHSLDQLFAFRPVLGWARYRTPIKGLYLCGSGTHPGGGITGAPGLNASREILKSLR